MTRVFSRHFQLLFLAILLIAGASSCRNSEDKPDITEFYLINNTSHTLVLHYSSVKLSQDSSCLIAPHQQFRVWFSAGMKENMTLQSFIDQHLIRLMDENNVDWLPRISRESQWEKMKLPGESGTRELSFILMNPMDDGMNRLQNLGLIKLFRISQGLAYLIMLSSIIGLMYVRLRFRIFYILLAAFLHFPVIYFTADFGYFIRYIFDPWFIIPTWAVDATTYYVRCSIPAGAMIVWAVLIGCKYFRVEKN
jgi:hypothetical protein